MLPEFRKIVLSKVDRIVSFIDRDPNSETYGCCYPAYWRGDADPMVPIPNFVNARWQEIGYTLALLYDYDSPDNPYFKKPETLEWIRAILRFWAGLQKPDGSFSEVLEDGHEQPSTATSTAAMCHAWLRILPFITSEEKQVCLPAFKRAAEFLVRHPNHVNLRYEAASLTALYGIHNIMPRFNFDVFASEKLEHIAKLQSPDGWFRELEGPDFGMNTIMLFHLAHYYKISNDEKAKPVIEKLLAFLKYFVYPDCVSGGGFNSQCASAMAPGAFSMIRKDFKLAEELLSYSIRSLTEGIISDHIEFVDYHLSNQFYKYLQTLIDLKEIENIPKKSFYDVPADSGGSFDKNFKDAKIRIVKRSNYYGVFGPGGTIAALYSYRSNTTQALSSPTYQRAISGLKIEANDGTLWSSMLRSQETRQDGKSNLTCSCRVTPVNLSQFSRWDFMSEKYPLEFMSDWSKEKLVPTRLLQKMKESWEQSFLPRFLNNTQSQILDENEVFQFNRRFEFRHGYIDCANQVTQRTENREFKTSAICESIYIPQNRTPQEYKIIAGNRSFSLQDFQKENSQKIDSFEIQYKNKTEIIFTLDGPRNVTFNWLRQKSDYANILRFLSGTCLLLSIDFKDDLMANWKARVDYRIHFEKIKSEEPEKF